MDERWLRFRIALDRDTLPVAERCAETLGALVTWVENLDSPPVLEPGPGESPIWDRIWLAALLPEDTDRDLVRLALGAVLPASAETLEFGIVADRDWDAEWRKSLEPLRFGRRTWVCPSGKTVQAPDAVVLDLDPGLAFGTGTHGTTAMCLGWLDGEPLAGVRVLDYGCGSGILSVAALALGAASATGVDNDPQALTASRANARRNGVSERLALHAPEDFRPQPFDIVLANILSGILIGLAPRLFDCMQAGTRVVLSGILQEQASEVIEAYRPRVALRRAEVRDGWVLLTGRAGEAAG